MASQKNSMDELQGLISDRHKYEGWLSALKARKSSVPEAVYSKVEADYQRRLDEVLEGLASRTEELNSQISEMESQVSGFQSSEKELLDKRQEAELRTSVGEYTQEEWAEISGEVDGDLSRLAGERGEVESKLNELKKILGLSTQPIADQEVTESIKTYVAEPEAPSPASDKQADGAPSAPEVTQQNNSFAPNLTFDSAPAAAQDMPLEREILARSEPAGSGSQASVPETGIEKTLKCPECGTPNYASEWYCERCGGELAAL